MNKYNNIIPSLSLREDFINRSRVLSNGFTINGSPPIDNGYIASPANYITISKLKVNAFRGEFSLVFDLILPPKSDRTIMGMGNWRIYTFSSNDRIYFRSRINGAYYYSFISISGLYETRVTLTCTISESGGNVTHNMFLNSDSFNYVVAGSIDEFQDNPGIGCYASGGNSLQSKIYSFNYFRGYALTQEDHLQLHNDTLTSNLEPHKSTIFLPSNREYTESGGDKVTPAIGTSGVTEVTCGDGTTSTTYPTLGTDRMWTFDGGDYLNAGDDDDFSFTVSNAFTVGCLINRISDTQLHLLGKYTTIAVGGGEWILTSFTGFRPEFIMVDDTLGGSKYWIGATDTLLAGQDYSLIFTYDGSGSFGTTNGILYVNGIDVSSIAGSSGSFTDMRNTTNNLVLGARSNIVGPLPNGTKFGLPFIYPVELSPLQVKIMHANMMRWTTI